MCGFDYVIVNLCIGNYKRISISTWVIFLVSIKSFDRIYRIYRIGSYPVNHVNPVWKFHRYGPSHQPLELILISVSLRYWK